MDVSTLPKTRAEAKACGAAYYFTGEPCKHGHVAPRKTKGACLECLRAEWERSKETRAEYFAEYNRSERGVESKKRYYAANREQVIAKARQRPPEAVRVYKQKYKDQNPDLYRALVNMRRRRMRHATPKWLTPDHKAEIKMQYQLALALSKRTGEQYVVDHLYPLHGETVCGLHVPWNLQVILWDENLEKSNALPPDTMALAFPRGR